MFWKSDPWWEKKAKTCWDGEIRSSQLEWEKGHSYRLDMIPVVQTTYAKCLDIGAGSGLVTERIKDKGYKVIGIDCSEKAIELAQSKGIEMLKLNVEEDRLPFEDKSFDLITCFEVIEHLREPSNMLEEAYRTLKDNGYFIISTPNIAWWYLRVKLLFGIWYPHSSDHIRFFTPASLKECLRFFGFKVVKISSSFIFPRVPRVIFYRLPFLHSISYDFVCQCVKIIEREIDTSCSN